MLPYSNHTMHVKACVVGGIVLLLCCTHCPTNRHSYVQANRGIECTAVIHQIINTSTAQQLSRNVLGCNTVSSVFTVSLDCVVALIVCVVVCVAGVVAGSV